MAQSCTRGGSDWTLGSSFLLRGWSDTGTSFPLSESWSRPQACQCSRDIRTISFNFWSALNWARQLDQMVTAGPFQVKNIIFYALVGPIFRTGTILDCQGWGFFCLFGDFLIVCLGFVCLFGFFLGLKNSYDVLKKGLQILQIKEQEATGIQSVFASWPEH